MEVINLNLIPNGTNPVVHVSQYDEGRDFRFNLFDGTSVLTLDGTETIECDVKKPDGNIVTVAVPNTSDSYIVVTTTLQMTACGGNSLGTIKISKGDDNLYTLNFVLYCERSPLENGIESDSSIHNLNTMVDEMVAEDVAEQYDSANVIFDNEPTDNHGIGYTVTSEGIKTAIDNAFDYDNTASGSIVHIEDGADNIPVKLLTSEIVAVQSGSGTPSPSNPRAISGFNSGIITRCGKNLIGFPNVDFTIANMRFYSDGTAIKLSGTSTSEISSINTNFKNNFAFTLPAGDYYVSVNSPIGVGIYLRRYSDNTQLIAINPYNTLHLTETTKIYFGLYVPNNKTLSDHNTQFNITIGDTATTYEAYNGNTYTFTFGQTVFGGYFDNKGNLVVTFAITDINSAITSRTTNYDNPVFYGSISGLKPQSNNSLCEAFNTINGQSSAQLFAQNSNNHDFAINSLNSGDTIQVFLRADEYSDVASLKSACGNSKIKYELANPITLAITSQDIPTLLGENNIFSNCGDLEVEYYTNKSNDILEFVDSEISKKNGTNIPIEENSQDSIKTYIDDEISSTKDYVDNGLNDKVAYKSGEVVYSNYVTGAYVSGSGNYVEFCVPINTKATSGTITNLGTTLNVFVGNTRLTNEVTLTDSSVVAIKDGYAQVELKLNSTQTANSVATVSLDGFTVNFA